MNENGFVQRRYNVATEHDKALEAMVEAMGGNVTPSYFVNLALDGFFAPTDPEPQPGSFTQ